MKNEFARREVLGLGIGAAAIAASGASISNAQPGRRGNTAPGTSDLSTFNKYGEELENSLVLRTSPIAVKMLEKEEDIPKGAFRPYKDGGYHLAQCQAFTMSRCEGKTVAMLKEDHWCPTALTSYGMVEKQQTGMMASFGESNKSFETGKYIGIVTAPLKSATYIPDVVLIYMNNAQLRGILTPMSFGAGASQVNTELFLPSCGHAVVDPMITGKYVVVLPDPGEYQRALAAEDEIILAVPVKKMSDLMTSMKGMGGKMYSHREQHMDMHPDFERPQFYKDMFKAWGLDSK